MISCTSIRSLNIYSNYLLDVNGNELWLNLSSDDQTSSFDIFIITFFFFLEPKLKRVDVTTASFRYEDSLVAFNMLSQNLRISIFLNICQKFSMCLFSDFGNINPSNERVFVRRKD
jgi:hypothetical protein